MDRSGLEEMIMWYYTPSGGSNDHRGPYTPQDLHQLYIQGIITKGTYVWNGKTVNRWTTLATCVKSGLISNSAWQKREPNKITRRKSISLGSRRHHVVKTVGLISREETLIELYGAEDTTRRNSVMSVATGMDRSARHQRRKSIVSVGVRDELASPAKRRRRQYELYQTLYVLDQQGNLEKAEVVSMQDDQIKIHYMGYPSQYDEWIQCSSDRIAQKQKALRNLPTEEPAKSRRDPAHNAGSVQKPPGFEDKSATNLFDDFLSGKFHFADFLTGKENEKAWEVEKKIREFILTTSTEKHKTSEELEKVQKEVEKLESDNSRLAKERAEVLSSEECLERKIKGLQTQLKITKNKHASDVERARGDAKEREKTKGQREQEVEKLRKQVQQARDQVVWFREENKKLKSQKRSDANELREQIDRLRLELAGQRDELTTSKTSLQMREMKLESLTNQNTALREELVEVKKAHALAESEKVTLMREMATKVESISLKDSERLSNLLDTLTETQVQNSKLTQEVALLKAESNGRERELELVRQSLSEKAEAFANLQKRTPEVEAHRLRSLESQLNEIRGDRSRWLSERDELIQKAARQEQELQSKHQVIEDLSSRNEELEMDLTDFMQNSIQSPVSPLTPMSPAPYEPPDSTPESGSVGLSSVPSFEPIPSDLLSESEPAPTSEETQLQEMMSKIGLMKNNIQELESDYQVSLI